MKKGVEKPHSSIVIVPVVIENRIFLIRGHKVMLDKHLAELYEVKTMVLNQAVKRNIERFPEDITICDILEVFKKCFRFY